MYMRKIAAAAGFACGAALAFAPLASADLSDVVDSTLSNEINSQNSLFEVYVTLAGADTTPATATDPYVSLTNLAHDAPPLVAGTATYGEVTPLETYLYGANPILAGISTDSGPYNEFNGASTELYNAYNVLAFAAANGGNLDTNVGDYLGSTTTIGNAVSGPDATVSSAYQYFLNFGLGDLKGYDAIFAPNAAGPGDILPTQANEIVQLNNLFELDGKLANVFDDIIPNAAPGTNVGFDTIDPSNLNATFDQLVFGAASPSTDPGSYDVFNGALTEFFNADNVGLFALLNGGDLMPAADVFGSVPADYATEGVSAAITGFLQAGFADIAGFFVPAM